MDGTKTWNCGKCGERLLTITTKSGASQIDSGGFGLVVPPSGTPPRGYTEMRCSKCEHVTRADGIDLVAQLGAKH